MIKRIFINTIIYGTLQVFSIICSFFGLMLGFAFTMAVSLGLQSIMGEATSENIFKFALPVIIAILFGTYAVFWYITLHILSHTKDFNYKEAIVYSILPNIILAPWFYYIGFIVPPEFPGCGFVTPREVFLCLMYSIILLPAYIYGLNRYVIKTESNKKKIKNGLLLLLSLVLILTLVTLLLIAIIPHHNFSIFFM